ncbi:MAG: hypothetical protein ACRDV6_10075, partial [Acidimicrobiales bacterium]
MHPVERRVPRGLYDPRFEHDACGIGLLADLAGRPSHGLVDQGLSVLERLSHRGASGAEEDTGDGSGILLQVPHKLLSAVAADDGVDLPARGRYAVGTAFLPTASDDAAKARARVEDVAEEEGLRVLWWRPVPVDPSP